MILLVGLSIVALSGFGIFWIAQRSRERDLKGLPPGARALPRSQQEMWRTGNAMARLLDRSIDNPVDRVSDEWSREAKRLVDEWWKD